MLNTVIGVLQANSIEYFVGDQGTYNEEFVSIFFQDGTGLLYEVVCLDKISELDFCEAFDSQGFWYSSCCLEPDNLGYKLRLLLTSWASQLQGLGPTHPRIPSPTMQDKGNDWTQCLYAIQLLMVVGLVFTIFRRVLSSRHH